MRLRAARVVEPDEVEHLLDATTFDAHQLCGGGERVGATATAVLGRGVDQHADTPARVRELGERRSEDAGLAAARLGEPDEHLQRRRLAGPVGTEEPGDCSGFAAERDVPHGGTPAVALGE